MGENRTNSRTEWVVIPCGAGKQDTDAVAAELYTGSMFKMSLDAARALVDDQHILILSALHGLVALDEVLAPYDVKMGDERSVTSFNVAAQMLSLGWMTDDVDVYHLLPKAYTAVFEDAARLVGVAPAEVYEATAGIGEHRGICAQVRDN